MRFSFLFAALLGVTVAVTGFARADVITSPSQFRSTPTLVDLSQYNGLSLLSQPNFPVNGVPLTPNVLLQSDNPFSTIGNQFYSLGSNGQFDSGLNGFVGLGDSTGNLTFQFNKPVSQVGALLNYFPDDPTSPDVVITALGATGNTLGSFDISQLAPISTPNGIDTGGFFGFSDPTADISAFRVSNQFAVVANLQFTQTPAAASPAVPEPGTLTLLTTALVGILGYGWRHRQSVTR